MYQRITAILAIVLLLTSGCTSIREYPEANLGKLKVGDLATIYEYSGRVSKVVVGSITEREVRGQYFESQMITAIPRDQIESVEVERTDYVKSAAAAVGGAVVAAAAVLVGFVMLLGAAAAS